MSEIKIEYIPISEIHQYKNNAKEHPAEQIEQIAKSIEQFGFNDPIAIDENNTIIEGHGRLLAVKKLITDGRGWLNKDHTDNGEVIVPVIRLDYLDDQAKKAYILAHNKLTMNSGFDIDILSKELAGITDFDMGDFGFTELTPEEENEEELQAAREELSMTFTVPPITVLDARTELWKKRKKAWKTLIKSKEVEIDDEESFDAVLAEVMIQWFTPLREIGINVFDIFAGGPEIGFVASYMNKNFTATDIRNEQTETNTKRLSSMGLMGNYICADGREIGKYIPENTQDLFFTCPPYYDTHVTSQEENDASNQPTYEDFYEIVDKGFAEAAKCLRENRFAVVVAQNMRNHTDGGYHDFIGDIKETFKKNGFSLYDELVLVKANDEMYAEIEMSNRKVKKTNEDILVFFKGDSNKIRDIYGTDFKDFLITRENAIADEKILVFYKGDTRKIREEFGQVETPVIFDE